MRNSHLTMTMPVDTHYDNNMPAKRKSSRIYNILQDRKLVNKGCSSNTLLLHPPSRCLKVRRFYKLPGSFDCALRSQKTPFQCHHHRSWEDWRRRALTIALDPVVAASRRVGKRDAVAVRVWPRWKDCRAISLLTNLVFQCFADRKLKTLYKRSFRFVKQSILGFL